MPDDFNFIEWIATTETVGLTSYSGAYFRHIIQRRRLYDVENGGVTGF